MLMRPVAYRGAQPLQARTARPADIPRNDDIDRQMWNFAQPEPERRYAKGSPADLPPADQSYGVVPTMMQSPTSQDPTTPVYINTNCPPWVCPPAWSVPADIVMQKCIPWYEVSTLLDFPFTVPAGRIFIIKACSYEALNAAVLDTFQFTIQVGGAPVAQFEDNFADGTIGNPAQMYALSGHTRTLPLGIIADRRTIVSAFGRLRGPINFAGASPYLPGTPITSGNCMMKIILNGWLANDRTQWAGAPRPTDLGDADFVHLEDDQMGKTSEP
jgi:hypothetical protein